MRLCLRCPCRTLFSLAERDVTDGTTKYLMVTTNYKHTVNATETVECRCLVILALMCLPILHNSEFVPTEFSFLGGKTSDRVV